MTRRWICYGVVFSLWIAGLIAQPAYARSYDNRFARHIGRFMMGVFLENTGDIDAALQAYKQVLADDQSAVAVHLHIATSLIRKNDIAGAIRELRLITRLDPDAVEPHAILALLFFSQDNIADATLSYENALKNASKIEPRNADIYKNLGLIYLKQRKFKEAEQAYRSALSIDDKDIQALFLLATAYYEQKDVEGAERELKKALQINAEYEEVLNFLGYLYVEGNKNFDEAGRMIEKAVDLNPQNGAYVDSLGWLYFKQGKLADAVRELERASVLLEDPIIFDHLGDAYMKMGDSAKARMNWEKSLKFNADQDAVRAKIKVLPATGM
jgi:Tfp pilus assembly protein PilF